MITGQQVLTAIMKDSEYSAQPNTMLAAIEPFVLAMPDVLKDHLQNSVTLVSVMNAKIAFLRYCTDHEYVKTVVTAMPEGTLGWMDAESIISLIQDALSKTIVIAESVAKDVPALLASQDIDEREVMVSSDGVGLGSKALKFYDTGKMTIGDLLLMQPMVIFKNS